jgi:DNA adenine methylase
MRVVRDHGEELARRVYLSPYSREEFIVSFEKSEDPVEQARRTIVRSYQGWGSAYCTFDKGSKCGDRANSFRIGWRVKGNLPNRVWMDVPENIVEIIERLRGVVIEQLPYQEVIRRNDTDDTLIYADPPYVAEKRDKGRDYRFEFTDEDHIELAKILHDTAGPAIVSGYRSGLYDDLYHGWRTFECKARTAGNTERTEVIWIKSNEPPGLFD